jgi:hypothetical protein
MDAWAKQYEAWWKGWQGHWEKKGPDGEADETQAVEEDAAIPMGPSAEPDLDYRPPARAPFTLTPTEAPAELLEPLRDLHEGHHARDWERMARAWPNRDLDPEAAAESVRAWYEGSGFGRWIYLRHVDRWWIESPFAFVAVRGVEHEAPFENEPAVDTETVLSYSLILDGGRWTLRGSSQGWVPYGSAPPQSEGPREWTREWDLE